LKNEYGCAKHIRISRQMAGDIKAYCAANGLTSESDLIRNAISRQIHPDIEDESLRYQALVKMQQKVGELLDHNEIMMKYLRAMHIDMLSNMEGVPDEIRKVRVLKVKERYNKFFEVFQKGLVESGSLFERLLERYVVEGGGGES